MWWGEGTGHYLDSLKAAGKDRAGGWSYKARGVGEE